MLHGRWLGHATEAIIFGFQFMACGLLRWVCMCVCVWNCFDCFDWSKRLPNPEPRMPALKYINFNIQHLLTIVFQWNLIKLQIPFAFNDKASSCESVCVAVANCNNDNGMSIKSRRRRERTRDCLPINFFFYESLESTDPFVVYTSTISIRFTTNGSMRIFCNLLVANYPNMNIEKCNNISGISMGKS